MKYIFVELIRVGIRASKVKSDAIIPTQNLSKQIYVISFDCHF